MSPLLRRALICRRSLVWACGILLLVVAQACVAPGGVYDEGASVSYGVGFYEPYGYEYGGWGPGYRVGPPRGGERRPDHRAHPPAYRPAPSGRPMPSIPNRSRQSPQPRRR